MHNNIIQIPLQNHDNLNIMQNTHLESWGPGARATGSVVRTRYVPARHGVIGMYYAIVSCHLQVVPLHSSEYVLFTPSTYSVRTFYPKYISKVGSAYIWPIWQTWKIWTLRYFAYTKWLYIFFLSYFLSYSAYSSSPLYIVYFCAYSAYLITYIIYHYAYVAY